MMAAFVVRHNDRAIFDVSGEVPTRCFWRYRVPLIPKDQQTSDFRQSFRMEGVDEFKLLLEVRLSSDSFMGLYSQSAVSSQIKHTSEIACARKELIEIHHRVAEVAATGQEDTVANPVISLCSNN